MATADPTRGEDLRGPESFTCGRWFEPRHLRNPFWRGL